MTSRRFPVLPDDVLTLLIDVSNEMKVGGLRQDTLDAALAGLAGLPTSTALNAHAAIGEVSGIYGATIPVLPTLFSLPFARSPRRDLPGLTRIELLFLFHRSGWMREAALKQLDEPLNSAFWVAAVAHRLNDWVPQVREAAVDCAERCFRKTEPAIFAEAAVLLLARRQLWGRWGEREIRTLDTTLARRDITDCLASRIMLSTTGPMAQVMRLALRQPEMERHLPQLAKRAVLPAVRAAAAQVLLFGEVTWHDGSERKWIDKSLGVLRRVPRVKRRTLEQIRELEPVVDRAAGDPSPVVRRVAADALIRHSHRLTNFDSIRHRLANDRAPSIRERIDFLERQEENQGAQ